MKSIIRLICISAVATVLVLLCARALAGAEKAPDKLTFEAKMGTVTFDHAKHVEREKSECTNCHDKLFPQSKAPLNFKAGMHKPAEAAKASCGGCHHEGGRAFATKGNCKNCHVK